MNELQKVFEYENGRSFRTVIKDGDLWFVLNDVAIVLGIANARNVTARFSESMKGVHSIDTPGGKQEMTILSEAGLYKLVFTSRKEAAEKFTDWVASEVLPSIRKTGSYDIAPALPQNFAEALRQLADVVEINERNEKALAEAAPKVAFADAVNDSSNSMDLGTFAKILGTGRTRLFEWLREQRFLMENSTRPYQRYIDNGYFVVIETTFSKGDETRTYGKTQICGKGQIAIERFWRDQHREAA